MPAVPQSTLTELPLDLVYSFQSCNWFQTLDESYSFDDSIQKLITVLLMPDQYQLLDSRQICCVPMLSLWSIAT